MAACHLGAEIAFRARSTQKAAFSLLQSRKDLNLQPRRLAYQEWWQVRLVAMKSSGTLYQLLLPGIFSSGAEDEPSTGRAAHISCLSYPTFAVASFRPSRWRYLLSAMRGFPFFAVRPARAFVRFRIGCNRGPAVFRSAMGVSAHKNETRTRCQAMKRPTREGRATFCKSVGRHVYPAFAVAFSTAWSVNSFTRRGLINNRQEAGAVAGRTYRLDYA